MAQKINPKKLPLIFSIVLAVFAVAIALLSWKFPALQGWVNWRVENFNDEVATITFTAVSKVLRYGGYAVAVFLAIAAGMAMQKRRISITLVRAGFVALYGWLIIYLVVVLMAVAGIGEHHLRIGENLPSTAKIFLLKGITAIPGLLAIALVVVLHKLARQRDVIAEYSTAREIEADDEQILNREDPAFQRGMLISFIAHLMIVIIGPLALQGGGCTPAVPDYLIPGGGGGGGGGGNQLKQQQVLLKPKQAQKVRAKKFIVRSNSAISFYVPTIDESEVNKKVEEVTEDQYVATGGSGRGKGKGYGEGDGEGFGKGNGKGGGWGGGDANAVVQFIRLKHAGIGWDDGMGDSGADQNFLIKLHEVSGFKVEPNGKAIEIYLLKAYKKARAPAFVYLTGNGTIDGLTKTDYQTLRDYVLGGGMIFADCGSPAFDQSFRAVMQQVFPDRPLRDITNDDDIFQVPFQFPKGGPPMSHHGGNRSLGVRMDDGRLGVFYFPGDMNDAWKNGVDPSGKNTAVISQAYKMGLNVLYYAFTRYSEARAGMK